MEIWACASYFSIEESISQISTQIEEHNKEIGRLKKDNMKLNDYSRAWLAVKIAATIAVLSLFVGFHYRIDNFGNKVNEIHQILKESKQTEPKPKTNETTKIQSQSKTP